MTNERESADGETEGSRTRRLLGEIQALAHIGVWEWDLTTNELHWSDELYQILGLAPREVPAAFETWLDRVHPEDLTQVKSYFSRIRRDRSPISLEYRVVRGNSTRTIQGRGRVTEDANGHVRITGVDQDITDTKELATRLVFTDRMIAIGTLAGGVAHEINNPLAVIATNLEMLAERDPDSTIGEALQAVDRIRRIVRGLVAFSRADENLRSPIDVERVLELAINMTGNEIRHSAKLIKRYGGVPLVDANEARLGHVFINLLINAAEAIEPGHAKDNEIEITTSTDSAGWVVIKVRDSGIGIDRGIQSRVFDPFFTTKPIGKGTGLGLSICHGIVRSLGGDIAVSSDAGKGTTFTVTLPPALDNRAPAPPPSSDHVAVIDQRGRVMLIDDEVLFANSLRRLLAHEHEVTVVNNGRDAIARFRDGEQFDVIICDLMMPDVTGADVFRTLEDIAPAQAERVIFLTGGAFSPTSQEFLASVPNRCFEKPCDLQTLRAVIREYVARRT